jgi:DNA-binding NarL/FixJ family response regulator
MRLLLIDDADVVRSRLADALGEIAGLEVSSCAPRAGGIIERVLEWKPEVVVMDISMPGGTVDLIRTLKSSPRPPIVIALSSSSSILYRAACHKAGAEYFFDKVRDQARLLDAVAELREELVC